MGRREGEMATEAKYLLRHAQDASRRGPAIAVAMGRVLFLGVALLVMTVGTLAARSRLPTADKNPNTWHTAKISRMAECGSDEAKSPQIDVGRWIPPNVIPQPRAYSPAPDIGLPNLIGASPQHALRAPPQG